jgi:hypothetical protein
MTIELFFAVQHARQLLLEGHGIALASAAAALEHGADPAVVARLALEAHEACRAARADRGAK